MRQYKIAIYLFELLAVSTTKAAHQRRLT